MKAARWADRRVVRSALRLAVSMVETWAAPKAANLVF